jgi:hypothetical protein
MLKCNAIQKSCASKHFSEKVPNYKMLFPKIFLAIIGDIFGHIGEKALRAAD